MKFKDVFSLFNKEKKEEKSLVPLLENKIENNINKNEVSDFSKILHSEIEKSIDWNLYEQINSASGDGNGFFKSQFNFYIDKITLKKTYIQEPNVYKAIRFTAQQFFNTAFVVKKQQGNGKEKIIQNHPLATLLNNPKESSSATFWSVIIIDLIVTGEAFFYFNKEEMKLVYYQSELVSIKPNIQDPSLYTFVVRSLINGQQYIQEYTQDEMVQIKLPNPYNKYMGLSDLMAAILPILRDRYGQEYELAFFLRGGKIPKIYKSNASNQDQNMRFLKSLQSAFGGRRNQFSDIILPKDVEIADQGTNFQQIQLLELMKQSRLDVYAQLSVPSSVLGDTDGVNYANADAQMTGFWLNRILPLQKMICSSLSQSCLMKYFKLDPSQFNLLFDNDGNEYLDEYATRIEEDKLVAPILTINERRAKIGYDPIEGGDIIETIARAQFFNQTTDTEIGGAAATTPPTKSLVTKEDIKKKSKLTQQYEKLNQIPSNINELFQKEFSQWEEIILSNIKDKEKANKEIQNRGTKFSKDFSKNMSVYAQKLYLFQMKNILNTKSNFEMEMKQTPEDIKVKLDALTKRAKGVMAGQILDRSETSFQGYSQNQTDRVYALIESLLAEDTSVDEISKQIRDKFGEFYKGQAETIVRTEFLSSQAYAYQTFNNDLKTVADHLEKQWLTLMDEHTRDSHAELDNEIVDFDDSEEDPPFSIGNLRYPRDEQADPDQTINCRCAMTTRVRNWKD